MSIFQKPRGTTDWYGINIKKFNFIKNELENIARNYGFGQIDVPTFESIELFKKSIGEVTDINQKELYTIVDKKQRILALRPEGTSSVVRAYVENKMYSNPGVKKLFYTLNLFRYERPQSGRLREFHQFGVEYLNVTSHLYDLECLLFANQIIKKFKLEKFVNLKINYLGSFAQREKWINELNNYFSAYYSELTPDSQNRINANPLRILDDKIDGKKDFVKNAPKLDKFLDDTDHDTFNEILSALSTNGISYEIDDTLVRGLDYYTGIVFEFVYNSQTTNDSMTLIGGGRYSDLVRNTGGPDEVGLGFAIGLERLLIALNESNFNFDIDTNPKVYIGASSYKNCLRALSIVNTLRAIGIYSEINLASYKKDKCAHNAIKLQSTYFVFVDDSENEDFDVENLATKVKAKMNLEKLINIIKN